MADIKNSSLATNLISYWELEETSGTRVDSHGSNNLSDNNTVLSATGIQGNGADFEAGNNEYLNILDSSQTGLNPSGNMSFSLWFKLESTGVYWIIGKQNGDSDINYGLFLTTSYIQFRRSSGGSRFEAQWTNTFSSGVWHHAVVTFSTTNGSRLYIDNTQRATNSNTGSTDTQDGAMTLAIRSKPALSVPFDGIIDEVGFWDRELTSTDVATLYNSGAGIPYDAGGGTGRNPTIMKWT